MRNTTSSALVSIPCAVQGEGNRRDGHTGIYGEGLKCYGIFIHNKRECIVTQGGLWYSKYTNTDVQYNYL